MIITLIQPLTMKGKTNSLKKVYKDVDFPVVPRIGDAVSDSAFKDPYEFEVAEVTWFTNGDIPTVVLQVLELDTNDEEKFFGYVEMYTKYHGWKNTPL